MAPILTIDIRTHSAEYIESLSKESGITSGLTKKNVKQHADRFGGEILNVGDRMMFKEYFRKALLTESTACPSTACRSLSFEQEGS